MKAEKESLKRRGGVAIPQIGQSLLVTRYIHYIHCKLENVRMFEGVFVRVLILEFSFYLFSFSLFNLRRK